LRFSHAFKIDEQCSMVKLEYNELLKSTNVIDYGMQKVNLYTNLRPSSETWVVSPLLGIL